ncbi:MAG: PTS sugar transporter subunit IIA [Gammaproteobacteria bacterium]|nr:MAG: PTS sugar transporter subunit IIA [Gammaproteobacteria bacterium]
MSVGVLLITHAPIGEALLHSATQMLGKCPVEALVLSVFPDSDPDSLLEQARESIKRLNQGEGVLVMTDMYGSTPSNIANHLAEEGVRIVTGVNLPMLVRVLNYAHLDVDALAQKALSGGKEGILFCGEAIEV